MRKIFFIAAGTVLLELGLRLAGVLLLSYQESKNLAPGAYIDSIRILTLGDSTTADFPTKEGTWPRELERILNEQDPERSFKVINKAFAGANSTQLLAQLPQNLKRYEPRMVIAMMGIHDQKETGEESDGDPSRGEHEETSAHAEERRSFLEDMRLYRLTSFVWMNLTAGDADNDRTGCTVPGSGGEGGLLEVDVEGPMRGNDPECVTFIEAGESAFLNGDVQQAIKAYRKARPCDPYNARSHLRLGELYKNLERFDEAESMFIRALEIDPEYLWSYIVLGRLYLEKGMYDRGAEMFRKVIEKDPRHVEAYLEVGQYYWNERKYEEAEEMFLKALEIGQDLHGALELLSLLYEDFGEIEKAKEMIKRAIELFPEQDWPYARLGWCYREEGNEKEARKMFRKARELRRRHFTARLP